MAIFEIGQFKAQNVHLMFTGDIIGHIPLLKCARNEKSGDYDFSYMLSEAECRLKKADLAVANLECPLGNPPYSGFPNFNSPKKLAEDIHKAGIDLFSTANNHTFDKGEKGVVSTLNALDAIGCLHTGSYKSGAEREACQGVCVAYAGDVRIAFLSYTYGINNHPISEGQRSLVNLFNLDYETDYSIPDTELLRRDLAYAGSLHPDLIVVLMHWGEEDSTEPTSYQKKLAQFLVANGADVVIGNHPHVLQPYEMISTVSKHGEFRKGLVCYSLGNFISNQEDFEERVTVILDVILSRNLITGQVSVSDAVYYPYYMCFYKEPIREDGSATCRDRRKLLNIHKRMNELEMGHCEIPEDGLYLQLSKALNLCHVILGTGGDGEMRSKSEHQ